MPAFLITWNPRRWPVHERDYEAWRASALRAKPVVGRWNTGQNRRRISPGDVLYWLRQGPDRRLCRLVKSINRYLGEPAGADDVREAVGNALTVIDSRPLGAVWLRAPVPPAQQGAQVSTSRQAS